jgi:hypothetical protein
METYIHKKHSICCAKLKGNNTRGLHCNMKKCKPHKQAHVAKLIHRWLPTNEFLSKQDLSISSNCPRCLDHVESADHILICPHEHAIESCSKHLYKGLKDLEGIHTSQSILSHLEHHLTKTLHIPCGSVYTSTVLL